MNTKPKPKPLPVASLTPAAPSNHAPKQAHSAPPARAKEVPILDEDDDDFEPPDDYLDHQTES